MVFEEALAWVDSTLQSQINERLTAPEKAILKAAWENQAYSAIADNLCLSLGHIKDIASRLWKCLSNLFKERVTKSNFRYFILERRSTLIHNMPGRGLSNNYLREYFKGTVLIVDKLIDKLDFLTSNLNQQRYKVNSATDGDLALTTVCNNPPDIILLEVNVPKINGHQLCSTLKANPETSDIPIIFFSSSNQVADKLKAFQVGGADYITKPCQTEEVVARIQTQLTIKQQKYQLQQTIAQQQQTTEMLQQSRAFLTSIFNSSRDGMAAMETVRDAVTGEIEDFRYLLVNPIFTKLLGTKRADFTNKSGQKQLLNCLIPGLFAKFVQVVETGVTMEQVLSLESDAQKLWYKLIAIKLGDGCSVTVRVVDEFDEFDTPAPKLISIYTS